MPSVFISLCVQQQMGPRVFLHYSRLKDSIRASGGIIAPVTVRVRDSEYICIDGNTRLAIYKQFLREGVEGSWSEIKAIVLEDADQRGTSSYRLI